MAGWTDGSEYNVYGETAQEKSDRVKTAQLTHQLDEIHDKNSQEYAKAQQALTDHYDEMNRRNETVADKHLSMNNTNYAKSVGLKEARMNGYDDSTYSSPVTRFKKNGGWKGFLQRLGTAGLKAATGDVVGALNTFNNAKVMPSGYGDASDRMDNVMGTAKRGNNYISFGLNGNKASLNTQIGNLGKSWNLNFNKQTLERRQNNKIAQNGGMTKLPVTEKAYKEFDIERPNRHTLGYTTLPYKGDKVDLQSKIRQMNSSMPTSADSFKLGEKTDNMSYVNEVLKDTKHDIVNDIGALGAFKGTSDTLTGVPKDLYGGAAVNARTNGAITGANKNRTDKLSPYDETMRNVYKGNSDKAQGARAADSFANNDYNAAVNGRRTVDMDKGMAQPDQTLLTAVQLAGAAGPIVNAGRNVATAMVDSGPQSTFQLLNQALNSTSRAALNLAGETGKAAVPAVARTIADNTRSRADFNNKLAAYLDDGGDDVYFTKEDAPYLEEIVDQYERAGMSVPKEIDEAYYKAQEDASNADIEENIPNNVDVSEGNFNKETSDKNMEELTQEEKEAYERDQYYQRVKDYIQQMYGISLDDEDAARYFNDGDKNGYVANSKFNDNLSYLIADDIGNNDRLQEFNQQLTEEEFLNFVKANPWVADMIVNKFER